MIFDLLPYFVITIITLNIIFQLFISLRYNCKFVVQYLSNEKSSWNPSMDRIKLLMSIVFPILSMLQFNYIIQKSVHTVLIILITSAIFLILLITYIVINKSEKKTRKKIELLKFKPLNQSTHNELKNKINTENRAIIKGLELIILSKGENLEHKLKWTDTIGQQSSGKSKSGAITYGFIFDLFHEYLIEGGIKNLEGEKRKQLINFIISNFLKNTDKIIYPNLNKSYTNWKPLKK